MAMEYHPSTLSSGQIDFKYIIDDSSAAEAVFLEEQTFVEIQAVVFVACPEVEILG